MVSLQCCSALQCFTVSLQCFRVFTVALRVPVQRCYAMHLLCFCSDLQCFVVSLQWLLTWSFLCPAGSAPGCRHWGTLCSGTVPPGGGSNRRHNIRKWRPLSDHCFKKIERQITSNQQVSWGEMAGVRFPETPMCVSGAIWWTTCKLYRLLHSSDQTLSAQMQSLIQSLAFPDHIKLPLLQVYIQRRQSDYWQSMSTVVLFSHFNSWVVLHSWIFPSFPSSSEYQTPGTAGAQRVSSSGCGWLSKALRCFPSQLILLSVQSRQSTRTRVQSVFSDSFRVLHEHGRENQSMME